MAEVLRSHVLGAWHTPSDEGRPLYDAVTGAEVARLSSAGIDFGGRARLRPPGRRPRAARADLPPARRAAQGAGRAPAGAPRGALRVSPGRARRATTPASTSTAGSASSGLRARGRRELPDDTVFVEGDVEPLSKGGTFLGQHIATPLHGVAVQINAFNFPVWGPLEKLAPAFLAGVPSLIKPASPTAYLTAELARLIVESGLLPPGTVQFVAGSLGDTLDHLTGQDLVGVHRLRGHRGHTAGPPRGGSRTACGSPPRPTRSTCSVARPRRRARHARVRPVRRPARHGDDGQGGPEVHGDPTGVRAR